jgi:hypothetical protein
MGEGGMERAERITMWAVSLAVLLAGAAFSYAHLRQMDLWALQTLAGSMWRLLAGRFWAYDCPAAGGAASVTLAVTALVPGLANLGTGWRRATTKALLGNDHE